MFDFYKKYLSPLYHAFGHAIFGPSFACRFSPTCSVYAKKSYHQYGIIQGTKLTLNRLFRCNPFFKGGYDPVPDKIK